MRTNNINIKSPFTLSALMLVAGILRSIISAIILEDFEKRPFLSYLPPDYIKLAKEFDKYFYCLLTYNQLKDTT